MPNAVAAGGYFTSQRQFPGGVQHSARRFYHILFIIIEKIKGSPVDPELENKIHTVGLILLMILMVVVTINDIIKLF